MLELLFNFILTLLFIFIFIYLPGQIILTKLNTHYGIDVAVAIGLSIFVVFVFFVRWALPMPLAVWIYLISWVIIAWKWHIRLPIFNPRFNFWVLLAICIGVFTQVWPYLSMLGEGEKALKYAVFDNHDQAWHAALIKELAVEFPPQIPGFAGHILKNYHYFYDLLIAAQTQVFGGDVLLYIQAIYPVLISLFFGVAVWRISTFITAKKWLQGTIVLYAYLANNLAYFLTIFGYIEWRSDTLLLDQVIIFLFNQQSVLSIAILFYFFLILYEYNNLKYKLVIGLVLAFMLAFMLNLKIYSFIIALVSLAIWIIVELKEKFKKKQTINLLKAILLPGVMTFLLACGILLLTFQMGGTFIVYRPGWLLDEFFIRNILPYWRWLASQKALSVLYNQSWKLIVIQFITLIIFFIGNFHLRLSAFFIKTNNYMLKLLKLAGIISILFTLIGYQTNSPFNIIQFGPYAIVIFSILMWMGLDIFKNKYIQVFIIIIIFIVSIPTSLKTIMAYHQTKYENINYELLSGLQQLEKQPRGAVLSINADVKLHTGLPLSDKLRGPNIIGAASGQPTYYFDKSQLEVLQLDYEQKDQWVQKYTQLACGENLVELVQAEIRYLIIPYTVECIEIETVYESDHYGIYQLY